MAEEESDRKKSLGVAELRKAFRLYRIPVVAAVVIIVLAVVSWGHVMGIFDQNAQLGVLRKDLEGLDGRLAFLSSRTQAQVEGEKQVVNRVLPVEKPVFAALSSLTGAAGESGVGVLELSTNPGSLSIQQAGSVRAGTKPSGVNTLTVEMRVEGGLSELNNYLLRLATLAPLVEMDQVSIALGGDIRDGEDVRFVGELLLSVYWKPELDEARQTGSVNVAKAEGSGEEILSQIAEYSYYGETSF